jgi:putative ABC transport system ATP-binding protein
MSRVAPLEGVAVPAASVIGLQVMRAGRPVLQDVSIALAAGSHAVVVGPSGCGKTTLLSVLAGLLPFDAGRVAVAGEDLGAVAARGPQALDRFRAAHIGLVPQQPLLFSVLDALDNLLAAQHFAGRPTDRATALALLRRLGLDGLQHRRPAQLSRGQQQRVAIARALVNRPALILADEPTANLDDATTDQVLSLLRAQADAEGASLLIATHDARVRDRFGHVLELPAR